MKTLCIDIGNTSTHYGFVENAQVSHAGDLSTDALLKDPVTVCASVEALLAEADGSAYCSVVPAANAALENILQLNEKPCLHLTAQNCAPLAINYPKPGEIGEDRLANALAARTYFGVPAIVIDLGTAVTFDIISSKGYEGGIIAPGIGLMTSYLHEQTALLPKLNPEDLIQVEGAIGKSTHQAMQLGVAVGYSGMLNALCDRVIGELRKREGSEPLILTTGGSTANLTSNWANKAEFVPHLTLLGLGAACA
ncbi:MAG: Type III pantothenate kinase [Opitutia bacterium UBA7350]|nr:MAG: Type III pantothenate kinase [Opitutae bacterium UBA7350]